VSAAANVPPVALVAGAVGLGALVYVWMQARPGQNLAAAAGTAAVGAVVDAGAGAVVGIGEVFGIPATNPEQCAVDLANGDYWAASFSCPAKRFLTAVVSQDSTPPPSTGGATGSW
jgi:hypothetical protein